MATAVHVTMKPGGGGDYTTLTDLDTNYPAPDLLSADKYLEVEVYSGGSAAPSAITLNSSKWKTDATHFIRFTAAPGHGHVGVYDPAKAAFFRSSHSGTYIGSTGADGVVLKFKHMQFFASGSAALNVLNLAATSGLTPGIEIDECIVVGRTTANSGTTNALAVTRGDNWYVRNSVVMVKAGVASAIANVLTMATAGTGHAANCTLIHLGAGSTKRIFSASFSGDSQNNYLGGVSGTLCYPASGVTKGANDATFNTEATTVALRNIAYSTANFTSVTDAAENLHLVSGSALRGVGANLYSSGIITDIDGVYRPSWGGFDIGADQYPLPKRSSIFLFGA